MSFERHTRVPVPPEEQCGHLTTICKCEHGIHAHLVGGCDRCECQRFEARPCRFRKGRCSATIKMANRRAKELQQAELPSADELERWHAEDDTMREIDPAQCGVYFIQCEGFIKIGKTVDLPRRLMAHQMSTPFDLAVVGFVRCPSCRLDEMEGQFHRRFSALHHRGEWFRMGEPLASFLEEIRPENAKSPSAGIGEW